MLQLQSGHERILTQICCSRAGLTLPHPMEKVNGRPPHPQRTELSRARSLVKVNLLRNLSPLSACVKAKGMWHKLQKGKVIHTNCILISNYRMKTVTSSRISFIVVYIFIHFNEFFSSSSPLPLFVFGM